MKPLMILFIFCSLRVWSTPHIVLIGNYHAKDEMEFFAEWVARDIEWPANVYIIIEFSAKLPEPLAGYTLYEQNQVDGDTIRQFMIRLDASQHTHMIRRTLAHELIHVRQIIEGRLILNNRRGITWMDQHYKRPYWKPHDKRPWEDEAIGLSANLVADFRKKRF